MKPYNFGLFDLPPRDMAVLTAIARSQPAPDRVGGLVEKLSGDGKRVAGFLMRNVEPDGSAAAQMANYLADWGASWRADPATFGRAATRPRR